MDIEVAKLVAGAAVGAGGAAAVAGAGAVIEAKEKGTELEKPVEAAAGAS